MRNQTLAACLAVVLTAGGVRSQESFRTTEDKTGLWLTYTGDHPIAGRWSWLVDGNIRRGDFASEWRSVLVRSGLQWQPSPSVRFGGGYGFSYVYPSGQSGLHTPEHRVYQQMLLSHTAGEVALTHRYRFENRWFARRDSLASGAGGGGEDTITGWLKRQRARYQVKATLPLGSGRTYIAAFDEIFVNLGANVQYNVFDQNRFAAGLGVRLTPSLRLESYYMNYVLLQANGRGVDRNHVWLTMLSSSHALYRRASQ